MQSSGFMENLISGFSIITLLGLKKYYIILKKSFFLVKNMYKCIVYLLTRADNYFIMTYSDLSTWVKV